ncbi:MAG: hypothetical protein GXP62_02265 [Oligoflexia bacterium]|nr:hypothetical protein [Oligoflexia bacterium]
MIPPTPSPAPDGEGPVALLLAHAAAAQVALDSGEVDTLAAIRRRWRLVRQVALLSMLAPSRSPRPPASPATLMAKRQRRLRRRHRDALSRRIRHMHGATPDEEAAKPLQDPQVAAMKARRETRRRHYAEVAATPEQTEVHGVPEDSTSAPVVVGEAWAVSCEPGLNVAHIDDNADLFGDAEAILDDLSELGAGHVRQPGGTDLLFTSTLGGPLPLVTDLRERLEERADTLETMLRRAWERGERLVLTMGTLGGGGDHHLGSQDGQVSRAIEITWAAAHEGQTLDGNRFGYGGDPQLDILDTRDPYQRAWLARYASEACRMLRVIEGTIQRDDPAFSLALVVHGIELFNEIDACNVIEADTGNTYGEHCWQGSAERWAWLVEGMARQVRRYFPVGEIDILLPGISSYNYNRTELAKTTSKKRVQNDPLYLKTWTWGRHFLDSFLHEFAATAATNGYDPSDLADSVDLHWYHREQRDGANPGPLHISRLVYELGQVRDILDDNGFFGTEITVFESGVSAAPQADTGNYVPEALPEVAGHSAEEVFQATEVWRRLAGAAAGGARILGWHCFEALQPKPKEHKIPPFYGFGLRKDDDVDDSRLAVRRLSWSCYQRFASVLTAFSECRLVLPSAADTPVSAFDETAASLDAVVFEFKWVHGSLGDTPYAWLVLLDRWRDTEEVRVRAFTRHGTSTLTEVSTMPSYIQAQAPADVAPRDLPGGSATFVTLLGSRSVDAAGRVYAVSAHTGPKLFFGTWSIDWEVVA